MTPCDAAEQAAAGQLARLVGNAENERRRATLALTHTCWGWFDDHEKIKPFGVHLVSAVATQGVHARFGNMSEDGEWIETEHFVVDGRLKNHVKGASVLHVMQAWMGCEARRRREDTGAAEQGECHEAARGFL